MPACTVSVDHTPPAREAYRTAPSVALQYAIRGDPVEVSRIEGANPVRPAASTSLVHHGVLRSGAMVRVPAISETARVVSRTTLTRTAPLLHIGTVIGITG